MSQTSTAARPATRAPQRHQTPQQSLRVVPGQAGHPGSAMFAALCMGLLVSGLVGLLMLNTSMAKGAFELHDLQATSGELTDTQEALTQAIDAQRSPAHLAERATKLGMVPAQSAAFLRLSDGAVLGVAQPAKKASGFTVVTAPIVTAPKAPAVTSGPKTTTTAKGDVTTTTVVTTQPDGTVQQTVTSVDARTKQTTTTTTTTKSATPKPTTPKPTTSTTGTATGTTKTPAAPATATAP